ncbi:MAG: SRPBCC family protein [Bacteroidales bacterium]
METFKATTRYFHKLRTQEKLDQNERGFALGSGSILTAIGVSRGGFGGFLTSMAGGALVYLGVSGHNPCYAMGEETKKHLFIRQSVLINQNREKVYEFWRDLKNLPRVMQHIKSVEYSDETITHWEAELGGIAISWDAEIVYDVVNWRISWNSLPESEIQNSGKVEFEYAGEDFTRLHVLISYEPKLGKLGYRLASVLNPVFEEEVREDIMRIKSLFEG